MRLLRVQVPEFRALKDVDISFEPDFNPQVFPLGSLNGGGKSTLLQLVFVLLSHLKGDREKPLKNILLELKKSKFDLHILANIKILTSRGIIGLKYIYGSEKLITNYRRNNEYKEFCYIYNKNDYFHYLGMIYFFDNSPFYKDDFVELRGEISSDIFLISPSNQPYLFLSREERCALFTKDNKLQYDQAVKNAQEDLSNFFTFDFVDILVEVFRRARAKDFKERNKENPFFNTEKLEADINCLFIDGKKIFPLFIEQQRHTQDEIQGVFFKLPSGLEIYPEDLSHGELKRLAIFVLITHYKMQDAIVLIDEIENGFHPRWQRYIVDDLVEWGATNQYILATHSYEVCRNLTFEHIKELSPRLFSENQE